MQHRHITDLNAAEYVTRKAWLNASAPSCHQGRSSGCRMHRHGTYARKTPDGMRVQRWCCRSCKMTFSALPDFMASHSRGTLKDIEDDVVCVEQHQTLTQAVQHLVSAKQFHTPARRRLRRHVARVHLFLSIVRSLIPKLVGINPTVSDFRLHYGSVTVLKDLRGVCDCDLVKLPTPVGFHRPMCGSGSQTGPPTADGLDFAAKHG